MVTREDLTSIASQKEAGQAECARVSPLILWKYPSLRKTSICYFIVIFLILTLYYGSSILIDDFNINPYLVGVTLATADFLVYIPAFTLISSLRRKATSLVLSIVIASAAIGLIFIQMPDNC